MRDLTPYDTGRRCQPKPWPLLFNDAGEANEDRYGKVDFDNDESATVTTVYVESGDDGYVLHYSGDVTLVNDDDPELDPALAARCDHCTSTIDVRHLPKRDELICQSCIDELPPASLEVRDL